MKFNYEVAEGTELIEGDGRHCLTRLPKPEEVLVIRNDPNDTKAVQILANKDGWLLMAKMCIEMAHAADIDLQFHIQRGQELKWKFTDGKQVLLAQIAQNFELQVMERRGKCADRK